MHILCIGYGTVLANTAVLCMGVHIVCFPVRGAPGECYYNTLLHCDEYFLSLSLVSCTFSVLCVYSTFGHHLHPPGYLCDKFRFFHGLHCWASPQRKITHTINHSIAHPLTQFIWCPGNRSLHFRKLTTVSIYWNNWYGTSRHIQQCKQLTSDTIDVKLSENSKLWHKLSRALLQSVYTFLSVPMHWKCGSAPTNAFRKCCQATKICGIAILQNKRRCSEPYSPTILNASSISMCQ